MPHYEKIDNDNYLYVYDPIPVPGPEPIKVSDIQHQINELNQRLNAEEPKNPELIEYAKAFHPFYTQKVVIEEEIQRLKDLKDMLQSL